MRRRLLQNEIDEAKLVFANSLTYERVWLYEQTRFPNWIGKLGSIISGEEAPAKNAITLGYRLLFPVLLQTSPSAIANHQFTDMGWLIHELTHAWQYEHQGIGYLFDAIRVQISLGTSAYDYGSQEGLEKAIQEGKEFIQFNPEQQGEITRDYYIRYKSGANVAAWEPFILQIQSALG